MEAVRLAIPPDALRLVCEYCSDRVGVHPTAYAWDMEVDRNEWQADVGTGVEWRFEVSSGRMRVVRRWAVQRHEKVAAECKLQEVQVRSQTTPPRAPPDNWRAYEYSSANQ